MKHEPCFVQALFLHVIETELQDELRAKLCQLLEVASVRKKKNFIFFHFKKLQISYLALG